MSYLLYMCLFAHSGVHHILGCVVFLFYISSSMLPVSLDCSFLIFPSVFSYAYLCDIMYSK